MAMDTTLLLFFRSTIRVFIPAALCLVSRFIINRRWRWRWRPTAAWEDCCSNPINRRRPIVLPNSPLISEQEVAEYDDKQHQDQGLYVPYDIVIEILCRVPVRNLIRLKSVSKQWNDFVSNMHLGSHANRRRTCYLFDYLEFHGNCNSVDDLLPIVGGGVPIGAVLLSSPDQPRIRFDDDDLAERVICSAGDVGLFLLDSYPGYTDPGIYVWNPATRQIKHLPPPPLEPLSKELLEEEECEFIHYYDTYGVGLDLVANHIKIVVVRKYEYLDDDDGEWKLKLPVFVYTLGGGSGSNNNNWRKLAGEYPYHDDDSRLHCCSNMGSTYFKGSYYWLCRQFEINTSVAVFDFGTEVFHRINCPYRAPAPAPAPTLGDDTILPPPPPPPLPRPTLFVYRGAIALFRRDLLVSSTVDVWLLSRSSSSSSDDEPPSKCKWCWIKHSSFCRPFPENLELKACLEDDLFVAASEENNSLVLFDAAKQEVKAIILHDCLLACDGYSYKETPVSIH